MVLRTPRDATTIDRAVASLAGLSLACIYVLPSQSGASFPTYLLTLLLLVVGHDRWWEVLRARVLSVLMLALLVYFSSTVWWSDDFSPRAAFSIYSRCLLILAFVAACVASLNRVPFSAMWLSRLLALGAGASAIGALLGFQQNPTWDGRLVGLGQLRNSVVAGLAYDAGLLFALYTLLTGGTGWRVIGAACVLATGAAMLATGSRNAYLSGVIGVWTLLVVWRGSGSRWLNLWWALPLLGLIVVIVLASQGGWADVMFPRGDSHRFEIWNQELQRLRAHGLWFGLGILVRDDVVLQGQDFAHPHSLYLASALQGGLFGLLLLVGVLLYAGVSLYRARGLQEARIGMALLATGMTAYLWDGWELIDKVSVSWLLLWLPVAIAMSVGVKSNGGRALGMTIEHSSRAVGRPQ